MKIQNIKILIGTLVLLTIYSGCNDEKQTISVNKDSNTTINKDINSKKEVKQEEIQKFTLQTIDGETLNVSEIDNGLKFEELKDKAIFLLFFGHRCPPCLREIPALIELTKEHKDLEVVAIEVQGLDNKGLEAFVERKGINYKTISSGNHFNFINFIQQKANWSGGIPFLLGLNKKGTVIIIHTGGVDKSSLEGAYQDLIKE